jgi:hypothetical protein
MAPLMASLLRALPVRFARRRRRGTRRPGSGTPWQGLAAEPLLDNPAALGRAGSSSTRPEIIEASEQRREHLRRVLPEMIDACASSDALVSALPQPAHTPRRRFWGRAGITYHD